MNEKAKSYMRNFANQTRKKLIKDKKKQKYASVLLNNLQTLMKGNPHPLKETIDYKAIIDGPNQFYCREKYLGNQYYGTADAIEKYTGILAPLNCCIEHGVYFGDYVNEAEAIDSGFPALITFGKKRLEHLNKVANVRVIPIGPYIHYATPSLNAEEIAAYKKEYGKTLLVFPSHSIDRIRNEYDIRSFIDYLKFFKHEHKFETVLICLYFRDVLLGKDKPYLEAGFKVITAGYRQDHMFLRRLKSFILISDYTISNNVGTHIGYSILLGKPHLIVDQLINSVATLKVDLESDTKSFNSSSIEEQEQVKKTFLDYTESITPSQLDIVNLYWGIDCIKSKEELSKIINGLC